MRGKGELSDEDQRVLTHAVETCPVGNTLRRAIKVVESIEFAEKHVLKCIIGGGEEGEKTLVRTKEEADHSLPYLIAAGLLDDRVMPEQYRSERIQSPDVQALLRRVMPGAERFTERNGRLPITFWMRGWTKARAPRGSM